MKLLKLNFSHRHKKEEVILKKARKQLTIIWVPAVKLFLGFCIWRNITKYVDVKITVRAPFSFPWIQETRENFFWGCMEYMEGNLRHYNNNNNNIIIILSELEEADSTRKLLHHHRLILYKKVQIWKMSKTSCGLKLYFWETTDTAENWAYSTLKTEGAFLCWLK